MSKRHTKNKKDKARRPPQFTNNIEAVKPISKRLVGFLTYRGNVVADILGNSFFAPRVYTKDVTMVKWVATEASYDEATNTTRVELDGEEL
jgi:hypothetical protein